MYYIYDITNLRIPYFLDHRPAVFDTQEDAVHMCNIMNSIIKDHTFIVTCQRGLSLGARVSVSDDTKTVRGTISAVQLIRNSVSLLYKVEYDEGGYDWLCDFELESIIE